MTGFPDEREKAASADGPIPEALSRAPAAFSLRCALTQPHVETTGPICHTRQGYMVLMDEENICTSLASFEGIDPCVEVF